MKIRTNLSARSVAILSIMTALVAATTLAIRIPIPFIGGYFNLGDAAVMIAGVLFGPFVGAFAGGIGSAMADLIGGFGHWAPFTLFIKGLEGLIIGLAAMKFSNKLILAIFSVLAGLEMVIGYFVTMFYMYGYPAALSDLPLLIGQLIVGVIGAIGVISIRDRLPGFYIKE